MGKKSTEITESCGCVFCDLNVPIDIVEGKFVHRHPDQGTGSSPCTKPEGCLVVDLSERRNALARPDGDFVRKDGFGREMFLFLLSYDLGGDEYGTEIWAYDQHDAQQRVAAMRESLRYDGQIHSSWSA